MQKELTFNKKAKKKLLKGVEKCANAVELTMGAKGRNVIIERKLSAPLIVNDGVTVAKQVFLPDPLENMGAQMVRSASMQANEIAGDGSSTTCSLTKAIYKEGLKHVLRGVSPVGMKKGIDKAVEIAVRNINSMSKPVSGKEDIIRIGSISANNDRAIGEEIANALEKVGNNGVITVDDSKTMETHTDISLGMEFDRGYLSEKFTTDKKKHEVVLEDCLILMYDKSISTNKDLLPIVEKVHSTGKPILFICDNMDGEALSMLVVNVIRGSVKACAIKAPGFAERRDSMMDDIAVLTGSTIISDKVGLKIEDAGLDCLGGAEKVVITKDSTTIVGGSGTKELVDDRAEEIKALIEESVDDYSKNLNKERLAKLTGGVAVIRVGAETEVEQAEKKERVIDARNATKAGIEEGVVPGGGYTLAQISNHLLEFPPKELSRDEIVGYKVLAKALTAPLKQIATNAGFNGNKVLKKVLKDNLGFDALNSEYCNLTNRGIIDPAKVTRVALEKASSVAGTLLTTECAITYLEGEQEVTAPTKVPGY